MGEELAAINERIVRCRLCPRLVAYREEVARKRKREFQDWQYWGKPVPGFGDRFARLLVIGLAPAAHGGNRTGRIFTGDPSGRWLYRALYKAGFANQPTSEHLGDNLELRDCYVTAVIHCAPPQNKPLPVEIENCSRYFFKEIAFSERLRVVVALGGLAFENYLKGRKQLGLVVSKPRPRFSHGCEVSFEEGLSLLGSYHPSQRNTQTGTLSEAMLDQVFTRARQILGQP